MIRPARAQDARAIAELVARAWRWAYSDIVAEEHMPDVDGGEADWRRSFANASVWDQGGVLAGVVAVAGGELKSLYVDPPAQGAGVGAALHDHALAGLRASGCDEAVLWTFAANGLARAFYEQRGWHADGAQGMCCGVPDVRYRLRLVAVAS